MGTRLHLRSTIGVHARGCAPRGYETRSSREPLSTARPFQGGFHGRVVWIVIAAVAIVVLVIAALILRRSTGARRLERKRAEARELRQEAQQRMGTARQREAAAQHEFEGAMREREAADDKLRRADDVDPDVPDAER